MEYVVAQGRTLVDKWIMWLSTEGLLAPAVMRFDFLVANRSPDEWTPPSKDDWDVFTGEITEVGGSLQGQWIAPKCRAIVNSMFAARRDKRPTWWPSPLVYSIVAPP